MKPSDTAPSAPVIIGSGRVGRSMAAALSRPEAETEVRVREDGLTGLTGRIVLLCVPDSAIATVASEIGAASPGIAAIGHTSGATGLDALNEAGSDGSFSLHPLQTVPDGETSLDGCPAAIAGSTETALSIADELAGRAGMVPFEVPEEDRAIYHAAASIASNYLVTLEETAADLLGGIDVPEPRQVLEPLVRRSLENWLARGADALTGPVARGDHATVEAHRQALAQRRPDLLEMYEVLATRTREIAVERSPG